MHSLFRPFVSVCICVGLVHMSVSVAQQAHLSRVCNELAAAHRSAEQIQAALAEQCTALRLAQARLKERQCRIGVEICHDSPMKVNEPLWPIHSLGVLFGLKSEKGTRFDK